VVFFSFLSGKKIHIANNKGVGIGTDEHADNLHWYQKEHQLAKIAFERATRISPFPKLC
jgi:hypothetical protein